MKHIRPYGIFEASAAATPAALTPEQVEWLNECTRSTGMGTWKLNHQTGEVDVFHGGFDCSGQDLSDFKGVRFGVIRGDFWCSYNRLKSLEGAPRDVRGDFWCPHNHLKSLVGSPQNVKSSFYCENNHLTSLVGAPQEVGWNFACGNNLLTSLEGAPRKVGYYFWCDDNPVSEKTLKSIFSRMNGGVSYLKVVESLWPKIPLEDQVLLYRPEFKWVGAEEAKKLQAVGRFNKIKGIL